MKHIEKIEFKDVSLSYDGVNTILDKISFVAEKPKQIAIVGKSGTGKTSLVNLLPRFYDICGGSILINDIDYKEYKLEELIAKRGKYYELYISKEKIITR